MPRRAPVSCRLLFLGPLAAGLVLGGMVPVSAAAQTTLAGTVVFDGNDEPAHNAEVLLLGTDHVVHTDEEGRFEFTVAKPQAAYVVHADLGFLSGILTVLAEEHPPDAIQLEAPVVLREDHIHERVMVNSPAGTLSLFETHGSVRVLEGMDLQEKTAADVAGVVEAIPGIALSSAGPGATRPIVRGLDGDRVVVLEDGVRTGDLGSQSPDRGLPLDPLQAERVEVIQGPATLLYGSYAIGGAVNVISMGAHLAHEPPRGFRGVARGDLSSNGRGRRGGARVMAAGAGWFAWGGATAIRKDAYSSPVGLVAFSDSLMNRGEAGFGLFSDRTWFSGSVRMQENARKLPFTGEFPGDDVEEPIDYIEVVVDAVRRQLRGDFGFRDLDFAFPELEFTVRFSDFDMDERGPPASGGIPGISTHFENRSLVFRGELKRPSGRWTGTVGLWGHHRDYDAFGQDVRPPRTRQNALAAFTYNEVQATSRLALLFGARLERNAYDVENRPESAERVPSGTPAGEYEAPPVVNRDFLGASGSARGRLTLNETTILMGTASLATRSPSLEELYDFSPSIATRGFQIGNPNLNPERPFGLELALHRTAEPLSGTVSVFRNSIADFIFAGITGDALGLYQVIEFRQSDAVYRGFEVEAHLEVGSAEVVADVAYVDARLTTTGEYLPRIPPLGGALELKIPAGDYRFSSRLRWAARMDRLYVGETPTDGFGVLNLTASRAFVGLLGHHTISNVSLELFNVTNAVARPHTHLLKELMPEIGRGLRISFSLGFF